MRSIRIDASARHSTGVVIPPARVSSGTSLTALPEFSCVIPVVSPPTSYLPSLGAVLLAAPLSVLPNGVGIMKVLTPAGLTRADGPLRLLRSASSEHPALRDVIRPERRFRSRLSALGGSCDPGFAMESQARHGIPPNQVRQPTDCRFTSSCSPPRLATTQLPSITGLRPTQARTFTLLTRQHHVAGEDRQGQNRGFRGAGRRRLERADGGRAPQRGGCIQASVSMRHPPS